jgi:hypothetical protein
MKNEMIIDEHLFDILLKLWNQEVRKIIFRQWQEQAINKNKITSREVL